MRVLPPVPEEHAQSDNMIQSENLEEERNKEERSKEERSKEGHNYGTDGSGKLGYSDGSNGSAAVPMAVPT